MDCLAFIPELQGQLYGALIDPQPKRFPDLESEVASSLLQKHAFGSCPSASFSLHFSVTLFLVLFVVISLKVIF
jgi:hypothetical protein